MWAAASTTISSPLVVCIRTASSLLMVPEGTNRAASLPSSSAVVRSSSATVGSSPKTSSPTSASAMALRIAGVGLVTVSLRRSIMNPKLSPWELCRQDDRPAPSELLFMQCDMRPLSAVILLQPANGVELQDFLAQVVEMVLRILHLISHRLPFLAQFVEKHIQLLVLDG